MTTFGGQTIPPLFGSTQDAIFLRGVGAVFETDQGDGHASTNIPQPAINVGDALMVLATGIGSVPSSGAGWIATVPSFGGSMVLWRRTADGTAADEFEVNVGFTGMSNCQMASWGNANNLGLDVESVGLLTSDNIADWNILSIAGVGSNDTMVLCCCVRVRALLLGGVTGTDNSGLILLGENSRSATTRTIWDLWSFRFDKTPQSAPAVEQSYTPDPTTATALTRYLRFISTP